MDGNSISTDQLRWSDFFWSNVSGRKTRKTSEKPENAQFARTWRHSGGKNLLHLCVQQAELSTYYVQSTVLGTRALFPTGDAKQKSLSPIERYS